MTGPMGQAFMLWFQKEGMQDEYLRESSKHYFIEQNRADWKLIQLLDSYATMDLNKPGMSDKGYQLKQSLGARMGLYKTVEEEKIRKATPQEIANLIAADIQKSIMEAKEKDNG